jgi:solute carrier family 35, member F1/2
MMEWINNLSPMTKALVQGQWISVLIAGTGIFATILADKSSNFPLLMNSCNYLLLSTYLLRRFIFSKSGTCISWGEEKNASEFGTSTRFHDTAYISSSMDAVGLPSSEPENVLASSNEEDAKKDTYTLWYVVAAIMDVEANFLVLLAYNYTTITSVMLLDCFTIPCAMVLSYLFLGCRYTTRHVFGTVICLLGLSCIIINDSIDTGMDDADDSATGRNPVLGDILCLSGAVLYAASNVLQEHLVKFHNREQFLGYLGCYGFVLAAAQCLLVDLPHMRDATWSPEVVGAIVGFVTCLFLMYTNTTAFLQQGDAVLFNLSLLTSDVYAVIFTYFFSGYLVSWLYFLAFALIVVGLVLYHSEVAPIHIGRDLGDTGLFESINTHSVDIFCTCQLLKRRCAGLFGFYSDRGRGSWDHSADARATNNAMHDEEESSAATSVGAASPRKASGLSYPVTKSPLGAGSGASYHHVSTIATD